MDKYIFFIYTHPTVKAQNILIAITTRSKQKQIENSTKFGGPEIRGSLDHRPVRPCFDQALYLHID